jgi:hypothetical protein
VAATEGRAAALRWLVAALQGDPLEYAEHLVKVMAQHAAATGTSEQARPAGAAPAVGVAVERLVGRGNLAGGLRRAAEDASRLDVDDQVAAKLKAKLNAHEEGPTQVELEELGGWRREYMGVLQSSVDAISDKEWMDVLFKIPKDKANGGLAYDATLFRLAASNASAPQQAHVAKLFRALAVGGLIPDQFRGFAPAGNLVALLKPTGSVRPLAPASFAFKVVETTLLRRIGRDELSDLFGEHQQAIFRPSGTTNVATGVRAWFEQQQAGVRHVRCPGVLAWSPSTMICFKPTSAGIKGSNTGQRAWEMIRPWARESRNMKW